MKKIGLFLLAVVMVAGLAGCPHKDNDPTIAIIGFNSSTIGKFYSANGQLTSIESGWKSGVFALHPNEQIRIELPEGGSYRVYMTTGRYYWNYTEYFPEGETTYAIYSW